MSSTSKSDDCEFCEWIALPLSFCLFFSLLVLPTVASLYYGITCLTIEDRLTNKEVCSLITDTKFSVGLIVLGSAIAIPNVTCGLWILLLITRTR